MASQFDSSDFVDTEFESARKAPFGDHPNLGAASNRPPSREELDSKMSEAQIKLAELKRAQEELERERAALEEARRRQMEFQTGREEMLQSLTRGVGLLEEAEFSARRDAEQMSKAMFDLKDALQKVQAISQETWTKDNFSMELTRALTTIENARMEWNAARLKFPVLSGELPNTALPTAKSSAVASLAEMSFLQLCKLGFALTWPIVSIGLFIFLALLLKR